MNRQLVIPWAYWRRHRVGLLIILGWWLALLAAFTFGPARSLTPFLGILASVPFGLTVLYFVAVFCHAFETDMDSGESGYPRRTFTLPVPSWALAGWPMALAAAAVASLWLLLTRGILMPLGTELPYWWPVLAIAGGIAWFQALTWWPFGVAHLRLVLLSGGALLGFGALIALQVLRPTLPKPEPLLLAAWAVAFPLAWLGVSRARRGGGIAARTSPRRDRGGEKGAPVAGLGRTPAGSQSWFERRRVGAQHLFGFLTLALSLPMMGVMSRYAEGLIATGLLVPIPGLGPQATFTVEFLIGTLFLVMMMSAGEGLSLGMVATRSRGAGIQFTFVQSAFLLTRPLSTASFVRVKARVALRGAVLALAAVLTSFVIWVSFTGRWEHFLELRRATLADLTIAQLALGVAFAAIGAIAWTWWATLAGLWVGLAGRWWVTSGAIATGLCVCSAVAVLAQAGPRLWPETLDRLAENAGWVVGGVIALKLIVGGVLGRRVLRRGLVSRGEVLFFAAIWLGVCAVTLIGLISALVGSGVPTAVIVLAAVVPVPLNRVALALLALDWNRHR